MKKIFFLFFIINCITLSNIANANDINSIDKTISCPLTKDITWQDQKGSFARGFYTAKNEDTKFDFVSEAIYKFNEEARKPTEFIKSVISTGSLINTIDCIYKTNTEEQTILTKETQHVRLIPDDNENWEQLQSISPAIISTKECDKSQDECTVRIEK